MLAAGIGRATAEPATRLNDAESISRTNMGTSWPGMVYMRLPDTRPFTKCCTAKKRLPPAASGPSYTPVARLLPHYFLDVSSLNLAVPQGTAFFLRASSSDGHAADTSANSVSSRACSRGNPAAFCSVNSSI